MIFSWLWICAREDPKETFAKYIENYLGITVSPSKHLSWDTEIKEDHDGIKKQFIYLELEVDCISGEIKVPEELEKIEFIPIDSLPNLDIVPPSVKMFKRIGYFK